MEWPAYLDEYQKLVIRMDSPRVVIDNAVCPTATVVQVDSGRKHAGVLLEAVQVLTDLNLSINKAYISSDGRWFMDVFHVTDHLGHKLTDESVISYIEQSLGTWHGPARSTSFEGLTALELTGTDRPGLLSEVFAVLTDLHCSVAEAKVWTHNGRIACLVFVKDECSGCPIEDAQKIHRIESRLGHLLKGERDLRGSVTAVSSLAVAHPDRRLHQIMFADRDYEHASPVEPEAATAATAAPPVTVQNWIERGYSIVTVQCRDRPKLLFDVVCTLTDMEYVIFHGTIDTNGDRAHQEFYVRHTDGSPISSDAERQRVIQCVQAAIERRASEGLRLELCTLDRPGLLSEVTRTFRENGLLVTNAEVSTKGNMASNVFCMADASGHHPVDPKAIDDVQRKISKELLSVKEEQPPQLSWKASSQDREERNSAGVGLFHLGSFVRRNLYNLGLIKSCS